MSQIEILKSVSSVLSRRVVELEVGPNLMLGLGFGVNLDDVDVYVE